MSSSTRVNSVILESIPINRHLKRWVRKRWDWLEMHNGLPFACEDFKTARETLMGYRADPDRIKHRSEWIKKFPWHTCGWVRMLFEYMDSAPEKVLQLMKLYCGMGEPIVSVESASEKQDQTLRATEKVNFTTPGMLKQWLSFVTTFWSYRDLQYLYGIAKSKAPFPEGTGLGTVLCNFARKHSFKEWNAYYRKWHSLLSEVPIVKENDPELLSRLENKDPIPDLYCDIQTQTIKDGKRHQVYLVGSASLDDDMWQLANMGNSGFAWAEYPSPWLASHEPISPASLRFVKSYLAPETEFYLEALLEGGYGDDPIPHPKWSITDGLHVGKIHHIPKKGTVKRRSIAVPNRFIQHALVPLDLQLEKLLNRLPRDCTFDQSKQDLRIVERMSERNSLYVGSVDLSQATDHLPLDWMETIYNCVLKEKVSEEVGKSWNLFIEVSRGKWYNEGRLSSWGVGQPLGTLPSFKCLGITHNLLLESISFTLGMAHSPYAILGDDLIVYNRKVRSAYIKLMQSAGIPLSLHKSYEGNLVEFAGKIFVRNMQPFFNTDHRPITWNSLFDYQWATGIYLQWEVLPKSLRKKWQRGLEKVVGRKLGRADVKRGYRLAFLSGAVPRGSSIPDWGDADDLSNLLIRISDSDKNEPEPSLYTGLSLVGGHPINYLAYGTESHPEWKRRHTVIQPQWFRDKYRPVNTDKLCRCVGETLVDAQRPSGQRVSSSEEK